MIEIAGHLLAQTWQPWRIPGTTLWLPGSAITPIGGANAAWQDRSHRAHHLAGGTSSYVANAINGRPGIRSNGAAIAASVAVPQVTLSYTILMVMKVASAAGLGGIITNGGAAAGDGYGFITNTGNMYVIHDGVGFSTAGAAATTNAEMWSATYDATGGTSLKIYKNGVQVVSQAFANPITPAGNFTIGNNGGFFKDATVAEVYLADRVISPQNLARLHAYELGKHLLP